MTPYYDDGFAVIYLGDCREVLPAIITDPAAVRLLNRARFRANPS